MKLVVFYLPIARIVWVNNEKDLLRFNTNSGDKSITICSDSVLRPIWYLWLLFDVGISTSIAQPYHFCLKTLRKKLLLLKKKFYSRLADDKKKCKFHFVIPFIFLLGLNTAQEKKHLLWSYFAIQFNNSCEYLNDLFNSKLTAVLYK